MRAARAAAHALRAALLAALAAIALAPLAACGDDGGVSIVDGGDPGADILDRLRALPEVASVEEASTQQVGYRYFRILFDQPVDHASPGGPHFQQFATLIHTSAARPMVLLHTGYGNWYYDNRGELAALLGANQIVVEHRFFRGSRPTGTDAWQHLTIEQSAADHHRITQALRRIYAAPWLETGASKGGMTSVYHRRFYPEDVDGTVAYVAPISFGAPDYRYEPHIEQLGPAACRQALRDVQVELLQNRRAMLESRAQSEATQRGYSYTRVSLPVAVESAVVSIEWAFWQYVGATECGAVPAVTAGDTQMWNFLGAVSPVSSSSDDDIAEFDAYYYQAEVELGYPGTMDDHLTGLTMYGDADFQGAYPQGVTRPPWSIDAMDDIDAWVKSSGDRLIFLYGEWDPWSGGMFDLGGAQDSLRVVAPQATHGARIGSLVPGDRDAVLTRLEAWSGVAPNLSVLQKRTALREPVAPRLPPAMLRGWQLSGRRR